MAIRLQLIQFFDETNRSVVHREPQSGSADVKMGSQLVVQQNQEAIFFRDGQAYDRFGPGRHKLTTANVPLLTRALTIPWQESPFQAQVYFVGKQLFLDQKWGTRQPIAFRDREFGMIRLRGYGVYSFRVIDPILLLNTVAGTQGKFTTREVTTFLREVIVARLADLLGTVDLSLLDLATRYDEIASAARAKVAEDFQRYGLELVDFFIGGISAPDEVQRAIDIRTAMGAVGDLNSYVKFQAARSMRELAARGGHSTQPAGFGLLMPGLVHRVFRGLAEPTKLPDALPLPEGAPSFDDLSSVPTTRDPRALVREISEAAGYKIEEVLLQEDSTTEQAEASPHSQPPDAQTALFDPEASTRVPPTKFVVTLTVHPLRQQRVEVTFDKRDEDGNQMVTFSSNCGPALPEHATRLLEYNARLVHGAFAIRETSSGKMVVIQANQLAETADPLEISRLLTAIAWQADRAEEKLTGDDVW